MAFSLPDSWIWDFWLADDGDLFHLFYLHAPKSLGDPELRHRNARFGHATSRDLREWDDLGPIFPPGADGEFDETATWTGSVVRGRDGLWRMFYTGASFRPGGGNVETIGVATSPDLTTWTKQPGPLVRADSRWYETWGTSTWPEEAFRDPWVYLDQESGTWHMLITARADHGSDDDRGVIGHATSPDLEEWTLQPPLSSPGAGFAHLEVPQLVEVDGAAVLLFSCNTPALSDAARAQGLTGGIWSVPVSVPLQEVDVARARLLASERLYSGRILPDRTGAPVLLAFDMADADGGFLGSISDPVPVGWAAGGLRMLG
ncbi:glycosyl hydrolase family 32 [Frondihabitans peucedani]|uniref:beta-fructofuranosidase n=1 Tax=Frondihabitans peucedani TaxID=598626 RepID=A0ABP8E592_9MICO